MGRAQSHLATRRKRCWQLLSESPTFSTACGRSNSRSFWRKWKERCEVGAHGYHCVDAGCAQEHQLQELALGP